MPPKAKFTKGQITEAGLEIVRKEGMDNLTARALGKKLGSSACPIFTVFKNMEEVQQSVMDEARAVYKGYVDTGLAEIPAFKGVGKQYILFAIKEPNLFQLLFMTKQDDDVNLESILPLIDENYERIRNSIVAGADISPHAAKRLYRHLWIYTHGIATLCVTKMCSFTEEEISNMMTEVFRSLLKGVREESYHD